MTGRHVPGRQAPWRHIAASLFFFAASAALTWWFIVSGGHLYASHPDRLLSCAIAGAKWGVQIVAALLLLGDRRWLFIRRIGFVCFAGSCLLLPYFGIGGLRNLPHAFVLSLAVAVAAMIGLYYRAVVASGVGLRWFWGWMACLALAVTLQLTVVFGPA